MEGLLRFHDPQVISFGQLLQLGVDYEQSHPDSWERELMLANPHDHAVPTPKSSARASQETSCFPSCRSATCRTQIQRVAAWGIGSKPPISRLALTGNNLLRLHN
jgi:hypothetical protein